MFTSAGELLLLREDVGRYNALDKVIGAAGGQAASACAHAAGERTRELRAGAKSGGRHWRAGGRGRSSLAIQAAGSFGLTVLGFVRQQRFNIYCHGWRVVS